MSIKSSIAGFVRGSSVEKDVETTKFGDLLVAQGLPPYAALAPYGWSAMATAAVAALVVRPSTAAMATLWNGEGTGGKSYVMDRAFAHNLVGTANSVYGLWLCVHKVMAAATNDITARASHIGLGGYSGMSAFDNGATVVADGWFPWGKSGHTVTITTPGEQLEALIEGRLIVPPQQGISIHVVADVVGATFTAGFSWFEVQL